MSIKVLPENCQEVAIAQGWNSDSLVIHLMGFIELKGYEGQLVEYLEKVAEEENGK